MTSKDKGISNTRKDMKNPWEEISLEDYENHMSLESVKQLQTMNGIMKEQLEAFPVETAMILGIAGGNGLEHVNTDKYRTVYGVDINEEYLKTVSERYADLTGVLCCLNLDLIEEADRFPNAQLVIANLLIEYIGYKAFQKAIRQINPEYVSCVIQRNADEKAWVSDSPYVHVFDRLDEVYHQIEEKTLTDAMKMIGYSNTFQEVYSLPNSKALVRMDFEK